jgi:hypothetical protein
MNPNPTPTPASSNDHQLAVYHSSDLDKHFDLAAREIWNDDLDFPDKKAAIAARREAQAEAVERQASVGHPTPAPDPDSEGDVLLLLRIPDYDHPPEVVAQIAAGLLRGHTAEDYRLAVAKANRLLDAAQNAHKRRELVKDSDESEPLIPFGEAMKKITGQKTPGRAEKYLIAQLLTHGFAYIDCEEEKRASGSSSYIDSSGLKQYKSSEVPKEHDPKARPKLKIRKPIREEIEASRKEIEAAFAPKRKTGLSRLHVKRLRDQYHETSNRVRIKNVRKKKID